MGVPRPPTSCVPVAVGSSSWWTHKLKMAAAPLPISALPDLHNVVLYGPTESACCIHIAFLVASYPVPISNFREFRVEMETACV